MNNNCPVCGSADTAKIYLQKNMPVFQNKTYDDPKLAQTCTTGDINLIQCVCGFAFNNTFEANLLTYDKNYQNEQAHSAFFLKHLDWVSNFILKKTHKLANVCEVGCGKGFFIELLREKNINAIGCDPTYEGCAPYIKKEYFTKDTFTQHFDIIVLRHVLEHIELPHSFLSSIYKANKKRGHIYIEVPCFNWIKEHNAFWDICYEHVNYFTKNSLLNIFPGAEIGHCFDGQYLYVFANLENFEEIMTCKYIDFQLIKQLKWIKIFPRELFSSLKNLYVWGAGAKGNIFCNIYDKQAHIIEAVVDSNPMKQQKFIAGTGHHIISPEYFIKNCTGQETTVIVMNQNYFNEIQLSIQSKNVKFIKVEELYNLIFRNSP